MDDKKCRFFVKLDIRHFFDSIDKDLLMDVLRRKIKDKDALWVHEQIINSAPVACPIGYYTSPWYANLFLEDLDWHVEQDLYKVRRTKRIKYVRHYLRYADDILLVGTSKNDLKKAVHEIIRYAKKKKLEIKATWEIKAIGRHSDDAKKLVHGTYWCDIGGYRFCADSVTVRPGIFLATRRLAKKMYKRKYLTVHQCRTMVSVLGWVGHADMQNFVDTCIKPYVNQKDMRRRISHVDKERKRGT